MSPPAVSVSDLQKRYGDVEALSGISFEVDAGETVGLVGPNGAGKTTTLRIMATLLSATAGAVEVYGNPVDETPNEVRERIRYLPEEAGAYDNLSGRRFLEFVAGFCADGDAGPMVERGVEIAALGDRIDDAADEYSRGMTRKLLVCWSRGGPLWGKLDPGARNVSVYGEATTTLPTRVAATRERIGERPSKPDSVVVRQRGGLWRHLNTGVK